MAQRPIMHFENTDSGECYVKVSGGYYMECADYAQDGGKGYRHAEIAFDLDGNNVFEATEPCAWHNPA